MSTITNASVNHHRVTLSDKNGSEEINVFNVTGPSDGNSRKWDFDVGIPIGPVTFNARGYIDLDTLNVDARLGANIPIIGAISLSQFKGNLTDGVSVTFDRPGLLSGNAKLYLRTKTVYLDLSSTIFGQTYGPYTAINLFNIPI